MAVLEPSPKYSHETVYVSVLLVIEFWLVRLFIEEWIFGWGPEQSTCGIQ